MYRILLLFNFLFFIGTSVSGQSGLCDSITPFYTVDLSGNPGGTWFSPPDIREGNCCSTSFPDRCIEFEITLDSSSVGIIFDIFSGAVPSGALFYQINCGPIVAVGDLICLNGPGPHTLTFCKPGANQNVYSIQAIPGGIETISSATIEGCEIEVYVDGLENSSIIWHEITSGSGQYDSLFTCLTACDTTIFQAGSGLPAFIDVEVCGNTIASACDSSSSYLCDTLRIDIADPLQVSAFPDTIIFCENNPIPLNPLVIEGLGNYIYEWYDGIDGTGNLVGSDSTYTPIASGNYSVIVYDASFPSCSRDTSNTFVQLIQDLAISYSGATTVCFGDSLSLSTNSGNTPIDWYQNNVLICTGCVSIPISFNSSADTIQIDAVSVNQCPDTATLSFIVSPIYNITINDTICANQSYTLPNGSTTNIQGTYIDTLVSTSACDSIITTNLSVLPSYNIDVFDTICSNQLYTLPDGTTTNIGGVYVDTFSTTDACDSIITTNLSVLPSFEQTVNDTICSNESYILPGGTSVNLAGSYVDSLQTINGCDSIITTNLTVLPSFNQVVNDTICANQTYTLPGGTTTSTAGTYIDTLVSASACDSIITTHLTVIPIFYTERISICLGDTYLLPSGLSVSSAGVYQSNLIASSGCDSIIETTVIVLNPSSLDTSIVICEGESINIGGNTYNSTGVYQEVLSNQAGCDSIIQVNLEVLVNSYVLIDTTICPGTSLTLNNQVFDQAGSYILNNENSLSCDSVTEIILNFHDEIFIFAGNDTTINAGEEYSLNSSGFAPSEVVEFGWLLDNNLVCSQCINYQATIETQELQFIAFVVDSNNCTYTDEIIVKIDRSCPDDYIEVPNIISPNGDGANDNFYIKNPNILQIEYYRIYNRWGELVFESDVWDAKWDGTFRGQALNQGVYSYYIKGACLNEENFIKTGNITILK